MKAFKSLSSDWYELQLRIFTKKVTVAKETGFNIIKRNRVSNSMKKSRKAGRGEGQDGTSKC